MDCQTLVGFKNDYLLSQAWRDNCGNHIIMQPEPAYTRLWNQIKYFPLHPFLFAVYPAVALLGHNITEVRAGVAVRAILVSLVFCCLLLVLFRLLLRDWDRAAVVTTLALILFFTYGHIYNFLRTRSLAGISLDHHRYLAPLWLLLFVGVVAVLVWKKPALSRVHGFLNLVVCVALAFPLFQVVIFGVQSRLGDQEQASEQQIQAALQLPAGTPAPDIYYFILDAYTRDDTLQREYGLDNTPFLDQLADLGFYVARCAQSNYAQTQLSLVSSLNFDYLENLDPRYTAGNSNRSGLPELLKNNRLRQALEPLGYQSVAFETGFRTTEWENADLYLAPAASSAGNLQAGAGLTDFELVLIKSTAGRLLTDAAVKLPEFLQPDFDNPRRIHRDRILFVLDQLRSLPALPGPKLVFAHLVIPHPPYVFGPNGEFTDFDQDPRTAYRDQVTYLNSVLIPLLKTLITSSETPPIIVIQGDHGGTESKQADRMDILNAYYLPGDGSEALYENISPVNTFRVILNEYFGGDYALREDTSYFSGYNAPFDYTVIVNDRPGCEKAVP